MHAKLWATGFERHRRRFSLLFYFRVVISFIPIRHRLASVTFAGMRQENRKIFGAKLPCIKRRTTLIYDGLQRVRIMAAWIDCLLGVFNEPLTIPDQRRVENGARLSPPRIRIDGICSGELRVFAAIFMKINASVRDGSIQCR